jgi:hypothetical protein
MTYRDGCLVTPGESNDRSFIFRLALTQFRRFSSGCCCGKSRRCFTWVLIAIRPLIAMVTRAVFPAKTDVMLWPGVRVLRIATGRLPEPPRR